MKPWIKQKWIDALRSNEYVQGSDALCSDDRTEFCCLGVLTDIYAKEHGINFDATTEHLKDVANAETLSTEVRRWAGLEESNPHILTDWGLYSLSELNDGQVFDSEDEETVYFDFGDIAAVIEEQL
jgi:hypothetical protein